MANVKVRLQLDVQPLILSSNLFEKYGTNAGFFFHHQPSESDMFKTNTISSRHRAALHEFGISNYKTLDVTVHFVEIKSS